MQEQERFAEMLKINASLTSLNLGDNHIGAEGAKTLAEMLKVNGTLLRLIYGITI